MVLLNVFSKVPYKKGLYPMRKRIIADLIAFTLSVIILYFFSERWILVAVIILIITIIREVLFYFLDDK